MVLAHLTTSPRPSGRSDDTTEIWCILWPQLKFSRRLRTPVDPRIGIVLKIIEEQKGAEHLTLEASSRTLGVTEAHLLRVFKRELGMTFRQYLLRHRMSEAAELVSDSSLAIKGIALVSGYSDLSNFYRDFKEVHGTSPRKWRVGKLVLLSEELVRDGP